MGEARAVRDRPKRGMTGTGMADVFGGRSVNPENDWTGGRGHRVDMELEWISDFVYFFML